MVRLPTGPCIPVGCPVWLRREWQAIDTGRGWETSSACVMIIPPKEKRSKREKLMEIKCLGKK